VVWEGTDGAWQRIFDLGTSAGGEDVVSSNRNYLFLSPAGNVNLASPSAIQSRDGAHAIDGGGALNLNEPICVTVTYDPGQRPGSATPSSSSPGPGATRDINDVNNWLGRSSGPTACSMARRVRIYDTALNPVEVQLCVRRGRTQHGPRETPPSRR
jgi:hypothetical protein